MSTAAAPTELRFEPPGPGTWELDPVHFPRPSTRYWVETHPDAFRTGVADFMSFYGMLLETMEMRYVNGFGYKGLVPVADEQVPERFQRAEEVIAGKLWREQLREWDERVKPASIEEHRKIQAVVPDELSDDELVEYLVRCRDHHAAMISQHMRHTASAVVPTADFLVHVSEWTGVSPAELLELMRGSAPVSAGASAELARLIAVIENDPRARELLESDEEPGSILSALRSLDGESGAAVSAYLDLVGNRLLDGFDISEPTALELPDVLLRAIRAAVEGGGEETTDVEAKVAEIRDKVPEQHRAQFDELLGEARLTYRLRDERGVFSDIWASGLMRRAALSAGRRLADRGRIHEPVHLVDAGLDEMRQLVSGGGRALRGRACGPSCVSRLTQRKGGSAGTRTAAAPTARPLEAAARRRSHHARDRARATRAVRELGGAARGKRSPRPPREQGCLRGARAPDCRADRVRPDRPGGHPRHHRDDRGVQHPAAAARRDRHRQRRSALPLGDRRA